MFQNVLVATDGTARSRAVLSPLPRLVDREAGRVTVVEVAEPLPTFPAQAVRPPRDAPAGGAGRELADALRAGAMENVRAVQAALAMAGLARVETAVLDGKPGEMLVAHARERAVDLVAMGTHGRSGLARSVLGSVADHVLRQLRGVPLLLVRPTPEQERSLELPDWPSTLAGNAGAFRRVLVPLDGSANSMSAVDPAILASDPTATRLDLLAVVDQLPPGARAAEPGGPGEGPAAEDAEESLTVREARPAYERARAELERARARMHAAGIQHVEIGVRENTFAEREIVQVARSSGAEIVVMATHGRSGIARGLVGSVADHLLRNLEGMPLIVIRPTD
ncbi:MAG: universal stress protein [Chloroflexi bacterium]|nr:universal stress protein [Chloroflexota bacterium]